MYILITCNLFVSCELALNRATSAVLSQSRLFERVKNILCRINKIKFTTSGAWLVQAEQTIKL